MKIKIKLIIVSIPVFLFVLSLIAFVLNTRIAEGRPSISELKPNVISRGDILEIYGQNFGDDQYSSTILVSSVDILSKYIKSWSESLIAIEVPDNINSGLVSIISNRGKSKPSVLVINENIPFIGTGAYLPGLPFIETISPSSSGLGSLIRISGDNFGNRINNSEILFTTFISEERETIFEETILENFLSIPETHIKSWSNEKIELYLSDTVATGDVYIRNESGLSNAVYFEELNNESSLIIGDKKTYMINQSFSFDISGGHGKIHLSLPVPMKSLVQRNVTILTNYEESFFQPRENMRLYKIFKDSENLPSLISQNSIVDVYEYSNKYVESNFPSNGERMSPEYEEYLVSSDLIPANSSTIKNLSASLTSRLKSDYKKAKAIYSYVLNKLEYNQEFLEVQPLKVLEQKKGNSEAYSRLYCSLLRSSGIPSRVVTGLLVNDKNIYKSHWWVEFFLHGYGWFSVDPSLAEGSKWSEDIDNPKDYYWGYIDNRHIKFAYADKHMKNTFPDGESFNTAYRGFLSPFIEKDMGILDLPSIKSNVTITSIY